MALYTIGDLHLSLSGDKPMDRFGSRWENHAEKIARRWNAVVRPVLQRILGAKGLDLTNDLFSDALVS